MVTITVTDENEPPEVMLIGDVEIMGEPAVDYEENGTGDVATYTSPTGTDWSLSGDDAGLFDITGGVLTFTSPPDFEAPADADTDNAYEVTVEVSDGTDTASMAVTVTVTDAQEIEITGATAVDYEENGTGAVGTYTSSVADVMWSLSGPDMDDFTISGGVLEFTSPPDFESPTDADTDNEYMVTVEATDGEITDTVSVTVTVTDMDEVPPAVEVTGSTAVDYEENGTGAVGTYTSSEAGATWSLSGEDMDDFSISSDGVLSFMSSPDFEAPADADADNVYMVTVTAMAEGADDGSLEVAVTVTDVDEGLPTVEVTGATAVGYEENGTGAVGTYTSSEAGATWSLLGEDMDDFSISSDGVLSFSSPPDFEAPTDADADNVYMVTVTAMAEGADDGSLEVAVTVSDMDEEAPFDPLSYDADDSGAIERPEVIKAIRDYFAEMITRDDVIAVIRSYFGS